MVTFRYCILITFLSSIQRRPWLLPGSCFSPLAGRTRTETSIQKKLQQRDPQLFPFSRLYNDFVDGESNEFCDESSNIEYYNDFSDFDFVVGDDAAASIDETEDVVPSSTPMSTLQQRFKKLDLAEQIDRQQISDNWKEGYWGVFGCSLDPYTEDDAQEKVVVTCIRHLSIENDFGDESALLIVGRSDGSICWLQMENFLLQSSSSSSSPLAPPSDNDPSKAAENRPITTYFENKLTAKPTDDGGMIVATELQRREDNSDANFDEDEGKKNEDSVDGSSPTFPFDILAQIKTAQNTPSELDGDAAIIDMLPYPSANILWTIAHGTPNVIQGWKLVPDPETGFLLPNESPEFSKINLEIIHTSPIIAMKAIPQKDTNYRYGTSFLLSGSDNGQVIIWEISTTSDESPPSIRIRLDTNLLEDQDDYDENDSISSIDVDDQYLYLGTRMGKISIFSLSTILEDDFKATTLPLVKSFVAFQSNNPGVSTLLAAGQGILATNNDSSSDSANYNSNPTKSLIAGSDQGELKQWELIPAGNERLEYWPRLASQKLPGGRPHVYETGDCSFVYSEEDSFSPAILKLMCIQQVVLAATDHDLTVWDSSTGKLLYDMRGLDFTPATIGCGRNGNISRPRPSLIAVSDSVLITNGMENFVCVHDFAMDRITSENVQTFIEEDRVDGDDNNVQDEW